MKIIDGGQGWPTRLYYHSASEFMGAYISISKSSKFVNSNMCILISEARELIKALSELVDEHDAKSQREMAA